MTDGPTHAPVAEVTTGVTPEQYVRVQERLRETGTGIPGRVLQVCYGDETSVVIVTVYETREAYHDFTQSILAPILKELDLVAIDYESKVVNVHRVTTDSEGASHLVLTGQRDTRNAE